MTHIGDTVALLGTPNGDQEIKKIWQSHGQLHIPLKVKKAQFNVSSFIIHFLIFLIYNYLFLSPAISRRLCSTNS